MSLCTLPFTTIEGELQSMAIEAKGIRTTRPLDNSLQTTRPLIFRRLAQIWKHLCYIGQIYFYAHKVIISWKKKKVCFLRNIRRVWLWLNRRIVKYELWRTILPILRFLHDSPIFPIIRFSNCYSAIFPIPRVLRDSPIFPIMRFFWLLFSDFVDSPSTTRFFDFSNYTIFPIVPILLIILRIYAVKVNLNLLNFYFATW